MLSWTRCYQGIQGLEIGLIILSPQRSCQEVEVFLCQLSAPCIALIGIEGEVGQEVVGDGVADELTGYMIQVGDEEVGLRLLLVVHRIVGVADVLGAVNDGAELAFGEVRDEEHDVFHSSGKRSFAALRHLQLVTVEGFIGFGGGEEEELPVMEQGTGNGSERSMSSTLLAMRT